MKKTKYIFLICLLSLLFNTSFAEVLPEGFIYLKGRKQYSIIWGGHSTVLININGKKILTDPLLTNRVAGITLRKKNCKLNLDSMGRPDIVLVSHSHFDHLCMKSMSVLEKKFPGTNLIFPEGVENYLPDMDFTMHRMKTNNSFKNTVFGESVMIDGVKITSVYAKHSGGRYGIDSYYWNEKGHTAYLIEYNGVTIFFSGDSGYDKYAFKEIGNNVNIDVALIQTGPCIDCQNAGSDEHASTMEALNMFNDLKASYMVPVHYGSLEYDNDADYPVKVLKEILTSRYAALASGGNLNENDDINYKDRIKILDEGGKINLIK